MNNLAWFIEKPEQVKINTLHSLKNYIFKKIQNTMQHDTIVPYSQSADTKKQQVAQMFDNVASRYDFLNHLLSLGIDRYWRWYAINQLKSIMPRRILDIATGTGDLAIAALRLKPDHITGIDISDGMLELGRKKIAQRNMTDKITLLNNDAENLSFDNHSFDAITSAFGVRNFENLEKGLAELYRVLKPNGKLVIVEFAKPKIFPIKQLFSFYFRYILPFIGRFFSNDQRAYTYLPESVQAFPEREAFVAILQKSGFQSAKFTPLSFGICAVYTATK